MGPSVVFVGSASQDRTCKRMAGAVGGTGSVATLVTPSLGNMCADVQVQPLPAALWPRAGN
eukprot:280832-Alexandrium_andersonii.AAC.1